MKRNTKYVGLDVHQAMTVATVRSEGGRVIARSVVETSDESIGEFFSAMAGSVHVVFEEGTQAQWLYDLLSPRVDRVIVCDRRGEKRSGNKGDQVDADELSEQLRCGGLRAVYHGAHGRADLKELTRAKAECLWLENITAGVSASDMLAGVKRYAALCKAEGKLGTRFVMKASNWLDPAERRWTEPYHITESTTARDDNGIPASIKGGPANWVLSDREIAAAAT